MKGREIKELQNRLFDHLEPYFTSRDYQLDRKEWNINGEHHAINLYVDTTQYDEYSLRPGITILYKSLFDSIQEIVKTDDFQIFSNGHFDIFQKLANVFGINNFDECIENRFNKYQFFALYINKDNTLNIANRVIEFMESFGWKTIESTSNLNFLLIFYKKIVKIFLDTYENDPTKKVFEYPLVLDVNAYLTMVYLGMQKGDVEVLDLIARWNKVQNNRPYWVDPVEKIINHFKL